MDHLDRRWSSGRGRPEPRNTAGSEETRIYYSGSEHLDVSVSIITFKSHFTISVLNRIGRYHIQVYWTSQILLLCHCIFKTYTGLPVTRPYWDTGTRAHCDYCVFCHFIAGIPAHQLYIFDYHCHFMAPA